MTDVVKGRTKAHRAQEPAPITRLIDMADLKCTICDRPKSEGCKCWIACGCGWHYTPTIGCRNPIHKGRLDG